MDTSTPGLVWRKRASGTPKPYWIARPDLVKRGFAPKTMALHFDAADPLYLQKIAARCHLLQAQMLEWSNGPSARTFRGSLHDLLEVYQCDQDSPFHGLRADTRRTYAHDLKVLDQSHGAEMLDRIGGRDLMRWYREFKQPVEDGGPERLRRAHGLMTMLRIVIGYGVVFEIPQCIRLRTILAELSFATAKPRTSRLTAAHAAAIRATAHARGLPSIALAQAIQFELMLRQKDVIGEWVRITDPGLSDITDRMQKWMRGLRWEEIGGADMILRHDTSKTATGVAFDLREYPMVMAEIARIPLERRTGVMIVSEATGLPYRKRHFADQWRAVADAAGVPRDVWNMDSRAGSITEATDADSSGANLEAVRHSAGHSNISVTQRYSKNTLDKTNKVARLKVAHRTGGNDIK